MSLLSISDLRLAIGHTTVLHDVALSVSPGEVVGLLGPDGAGKTTTMHAALGLLRPEAGRIQLLGGDPCRQGPALRRRVGVLPDPNGFYDWMTAPDCLAFYADLHGAPLDHRSIARLLGEVGLAPRAGQAIGTFSRVMRQRLGLARALVASPRLLLLDEPTAGLDPQGRRDMHDLLAGLARRGLGILLCTHKLDELERLCTRACFLAEGRTLAEGRIEDLVRGHAGQARFRLELSGPVPDTAPIPAHVRTVASGQGWAVVDVDPAVPVDAAWRELLFLGWPVAAILHEGGGLESLYMSLVRPQGQAGQPAAPPWRQAA